MNSYLLLFTGQIECQKSGELSLNYFPFCTEFPSTSLASILPPPHAPAPVTRPDYLACLSPLISIDKHSVLVPLVPIQLRCHHSSDDRGLSDADYIMVLS